VLPVGRPGLLEKLRGATVLTINQQRGGQGTSHLQFEDGTGDGTAQARFEQADRIGRVLALKEHLDVSAQSRGRLLGDRADGPGTEPVVVGPVVGRHLERVRACQAKQRLPERPYWVPPFVTSRQVIRNRDGSSSDRKQRPVHRLGGRPRGRVLRQHRPHHSVKRGRHQGTCRSDERHHRLLVRDPQRQPRRPMEWHVAGEQLKRQAAERVHVRCGSDQLSGPLFRRHVGRRADGSVDLGKPGQRPGAAQDRDAKVEHLDQAAVGHHDVGRLDVAVHDVHPVYVGKNRRGLRSDRHRPRHARRIRTRERRAVKQCLQRRSAQQLHD